MDKGIIEGILKDFQIVTGMDVALLNRDFHTVVGVRGVISSLCTKIHRSAGGPGICKGSDIENLSKVKNTSKATIYTCPFGIKEAIAPVIKGEDTVAYLIATVGIEQGVSDKVEQSITPLCGGYDEAHKLINSIKQLSAEECDAHFNLFLMLAEHIGNLLSEAEEQDSIGTLVKYYVKKNLGGKITLEDIAKSLHCSTVTLTEHFKDEFGITIMQYVTKKRMELAEKMMTYTSTPLSEVALASGFCDVEYFSRTFKRYHGISPAAWRRENKGKEADE